MKMIKAFIRPEKAEEVLSTLMEKGFSAVTKVSVLGRGKQKGLKVSHIEANLANSKIYVKNVQKVYYSAKGDTIAMKDVNINVLENEFVCIVGPSGCGKSTLLRMVAGLDEITSGDIVIQDRKIIGPGADTGMLFQAYTLFPWMTGAENIKFGLKIRKVPAKEQEEIVDKYLKVIKLEKFRNSYPKELSGGIKQRVVIKRYRAIYSA